MLAHSISRERYCGGRSFQKGCLARISSRVFMGISESSSFEFSPQDRCSTCGELANTFRFLLVTLGLRQFSGWGGARFVILSRGKSVPGQVGNGRRIEGQFT